MEFKILMQGIGLNKGLASGVDFEGGNIVEK